MRKKTVWISAGLLAVTLVVGQIGFASESKITNKTETTSNGSMTEMMSTMQDDSMMNMMQDDSMQSMMKAMHTPEGEKMMKACGDYMSTYNNEQDADKTDKAQ